MNEVKTSEVPVWALREAEDFLGVDAREEDILATARRIVEQAIRQWPIQEGKAS